MAHSTCPECDNFGCIGLGEYETSKTNDGQRDIAKVELMECAECGTVYGRLP